MKKKYQGSNRTKRAHLQALRKEFEMLHMKNDESVTNYFARTMTIANKMQFHCENMESMERMRKGNEESLRRIRRSSEVLSVRIENIERRRDDRSSNSSYEEDKGYEEDEGGRRKGS